MKSVALTAKSPNPEDARIWLSDLQKDQAQSLGAVFGHSIAKRKCELATAFTLGVVLAAFAEIIAILIGARPTIGLAVTAILVGICVLVTFFLQRAATRAFLFQAEFQKRASSAIRIVPEDPPAQKSA